MKILLTIAAAIIFACPGASAQNLPFQMTTVRRNVSFNFITKDSVNLPLNANFELIEEGCSQITRYAHLNMQERKFMGKFKDVSRANPQLVVAEGNYTADGLKEGSFISRYLNGNLQTKGNFKNNLFDGHWELYYEDGKPQLTFEANGTDVRIIDSWDTKGVKIIDNGNGNYKADLDGVYWKGKLLNGKPEGTWKAIKTNDNTTLMTESYKNGSFQKGTNPAGDYKDIPRLVLVLQEQIPYVKAEGLRVAMIGCDGVDPVKRIVSAQYPNGASSFTQLIRDAVEPYLSKVNLTPFDTDLLIDGEVNDQGMITKLRQRNKFDDTFVRGLIKQLNTLPFLKPATVGGKPVTQKITFTFNFNRGSYNFSYQLSPIEVK
jgi:hypothetical protein